MSFVFFYSFLILMSGNPPIIWWWLLLLTTFLAGATYTEIFDKACDAWKNTNEEFNHHHSAHISVIVRAQRISWYSAVFPPSCRHPLFSRMSFYVWDEYLVSLTVHFHLCPDGRLKVTTTKKRKKNARIIFVLTFCAATAKPTVVAA